MGYVAIAVHEIREHGVKLLLGFAFFLMLAFFA
jgi:hypothetical protein